MELTVAPWSERIRSRAWFVPLAIIASLLYALSFLELYPWLGVRARLASFLFVCFWAWRSGAWAGLASSIIADKILQDATYFACEIPDNDSTDLISTAFLIVNMCIGIVLGRTATLGRRLELELERRTRAEIFLRESEVCYRVLFDSNPVPMWVADRDTMRFLAYNAAALEHYGYSAAELDWMGLSSFLPPGEVTRPDLPGVFQHLKKDGTIIDAEVAVHPIHFRGREARLVLATDVTERKLAQDMLKYQAHHDTLTGLPNRVAFRSRLNGEIDRARGSSNPLAILLFDLDRFKNINDTMGHAYGDQALQRIGPRLRGVLREGDLLARLGGDEFGVLLPGVGKEDALWIAGRLLEAFREPFVFDDRPFDVGVSVGIAIYPEHGDNVASLLHRADLAMYTSKRSGGGAMVSTQAEEPDETLSLSSRIFNDEEHGFLR